MEEHFDFSEGSVACKKETDYAHITYAQHKTNRNCYFAVLYLKENHYSQKKDKLSYLKEWRDLCEYEALCEGDDYWIVPDKLQRQTEYLDKHSKCMMCTTDAIIASEKGKLVWKRYDQNRNVPIEDVIEKGGLWLQTVTYFYRKGINDDMIICGKECHVGDYPLIIWCALKGDIYYINQKTAVYRYGIGWTRSFTQREFSLKLRGWRSEVAMLKGFDDHSNYMYHISFSRRANIYVYDIIINNISYIDALIKEFREEYDAFSKIQRFGVLMYKYRLGLIMRILRKLNSILH